MRAGYSPRSAAEIARELLTKPEIQEGIAAGAKVISQQIDITRERVLQELAAVALSDIRRYYTAEGGLKPVHELDDEAAAAIASIESDELYEGSGKDREQVGVVRKLKRFDKLKALELLGRHKGLWNDPPPAPHVGPGMTVIVQQGVQIEGESRVVAAQRVTVNLPPPKP